MSEHQDQESIVEITKCIQKNMLWSMYVEDTLKKFYKRQTVSGQEKWIVHRTVPMDNGYKKYKKTIVTIPGENSSITHPLCMNCEYFQSTWLPCACIAAVFGRKKDSFKNIKNIHPYWHLQNHPLWSAVGIKLGLYTTGHHNNYIPVNQNSSPNIDEQKMINVGVESFSSIKYPSHEHIRVARLREKFDDVANIAKQSKAQYQHFLPYY